MRLFAGVWRSWNQYGTVLKVDVFEIRAREMNLPGIYQIGLIREFVMTLNREFPRMVVEYLTEIEICLRVNFACDIATAIRTASPDCTGGNVLGPIGLMD